MSLAVMDRRSEVMTRARGGDADSFAALVDPVLDRAFRLAAVMLADRAAAEDAVQEASVKAWRKLRSLRGDVDSFAPWFLSIVANECRMMRRTRWWSVLKVADIRPEPAPAALE
ncbi:MAG TPA: sigma factor, partial [Candidatus Dormibacteraeota bacterium]|nr:sigma factor [Candidatus Dormibacteraeota bacterium]